jgi:hypothetical protein
VNDGWFPATYNKTSTITNETNANKYFYKLYTHKDTHNFILLTTLCSWQKMRMRLSTVWPWRGHLIGWCCFKWTCWIHPLCWHRSKERWVCSISHPLFWFSHLYYTRNGASVHRLLMWGMYPRLWFCYTRTRQWRVDTCVRKQSVDFLILWTKYMTSIRSTKLKGWVHFSSFS